jgi:two-component system response regulator FixJ
MTHQRRVYVVGQEAETRRLLTRHLAGGGIDAWPFASAAEFLVIFDHLSPGCVLLDMDSEDLSGIEVLEEIARRQIDWPVIAISGREELQLAIQAMKLGALDFLRLPITREMVFLALAPAWKALERAIETREARRIAQEKISRLTARELDVLLALLGGRSNKAIAHEFGISVRTIEMHRAHLMAKLGVRSMAEAALLAPQAGLDLSDLAASALKQRIAAFAA